MSCPPRDIGWVPQHAAVYSKLSVAENLRLFARLEKVDDPDAAVDRMLEQTDLRERADDELGKLSGGNRQRVNIAVGLLSTRPRCCSTSPRLRWTRASASGCGSSSARWRAAAPRCCSRPTTSARPTATPTASSSSPTASSSSTAPRASSSRRSGGDTYDFEGAFVRFLHERGH